MKINQYKTCFVVDSKNAVKFLQKKFKKLGLDEFETNEFITYWLPVINKNGKNVISFQFENCNKAFPLSITPNMK